MGRVRVYEAADLAKNMVETFKDRGVEFQEEILEDDDWPDRVRHVGDSLGVAYRSDKWKPKNERGQRAIEDYLHLAESRNRLLLPADVDLGRKSGRSSLPTIGPVVAMDSVPMPNSYAILGLFLELRVQMHTAGSDSAPKFASTSIEALTVQHGYLCGSHFRWSKVSNRKDQPFLFVYTKRQGILMLVVGDELDVEKDGIVG